jgi:hypothetical protein
VTEPAVIDRPDVQRQAVSPDRRHLRRFLPLIPLACLLGFWLWLFYQGGAIRQPPRGNNFGADYAIFLSAAQTLKEGGNPYDPRQLYATERSLLGRQHVPIQKPSAIFRAGNPPYFDWALEPLTELPFVDTARGWLLAMYVFGIAGCVVALRHFGWRHTIVPAAFFLAAPQVLLGPGNVSGLIFVVVAGGLALARPRPFVAGALLSLGSIKPQIALPAILLIWLFHTSDRVRLAAGVIAGTVALLLLSVVTTGAGVLGLWLAASVDYFGTLAQQSGLASMAGLYAHDAPNMLRASLLVLVVAVAGAFTLREWLRFRHLREVPFLAVGWLWVLWFLATPYAHFPDEILLTLPVLALIGRDAERIGDLPSVIALYTLLLSIILAAWTPFHASLLSLSLVVVLLCLLAARRRVEA